MSKSYDKAIENLNKIIKDGIKNGTPFGDIQREIMKQQAEEVKAAKQWKDPGQINAYSSSIAQKLKQNNSKKGTKATPAVKKGSFLAPAFDSFPKESQEKDHPLYGNLRY